MLRRRLIAISRVRLRNDVICAVPLDALVVVMMPGVMPIATLARMPTMATTISSSMSENPRVDRSRGRAMSVRTSKRRSGSMGTLNQRGARELWAVSEVVTVARPRKRLDDHEQGRLHAGPVARRRLCRDVQR